MAREKLILVISTIDREHNFLGLFDSVKKNWVFEEEFLAATAEEFFPIFKKLIKQAVLEKIMVVIVNQTDGSFSGLRLQSAIANSLKIANPKLKLYSIEAKNIADLKNKIVKNINLKKEKGFVFPRYQKPASIH
jgi:tRNA A37 threonylcarbamoyladenosine modification protein TsaB